MTHRHNSTANMPPIGPLAFLICSQILWPVAATAADPHSSIRSSLVYISASGVDQNTGQPVGQHATGFIVSEDGLVLTVYHLLERSLANISPDSLKIKASISEKTSQQIEASIVNAVIPNDLLLLKLEEPALKSYVPARLGNLSSYKNTDPLFTSGFPDVQAYRSQQGVVNARTSPARFLWDTSIHFWPGESGSPMYNSDAEVVGLAKGDLGVSEPQGGAAAPQSPVRDGYMIPIGYAETLLLSIRLTDIQTRLKEFEAIRTQMRWSAKVTNRTLSLEYEKTVPGNPHVESIDLTIWVSGIDKAQKAFSSAQWPMVWPGIAREAVSASRGLFRLENFWKTVMSDCETRKVAVIQQVHLQFKASLSNGDSRDEEVVLTPGLEL